MSSGIRNAMVAFGVISAIVTVWQLVEMEKGRESAAKERKLMLETLRRIEKKLGA